MGEFTRNLPYYLLYQNDFAPGGPFGHTWSLAIEEKYYLLWPALGFAGVATFRRYELWVLSAIMLAAIVFEYTPLQYSAIYTPLIFGSIVACVMHNPNGFALVSRLAYPAISCGLMIAACAALALPAGAPRTHTSFAVLFGIAIPGIVLASGWFAKATQIPVLVRVGELTYAAYLFHSLVKSCVDVVVPAGQTDVLIEVARFGGTVLLSFAGCYVLFRFFELPINQFGKRLAIRASRTSTLVIASVSKKSPLMAQNALPATTALAIRRRAI